jgi:hypothetical protein
MKLKMLGLAGLSFLAVAITAASASATTLELTGVTRNASTAISSELKSGTLSVLSRTDGTLANACDTSLFVGATEGSFTGTRVTGALSDLTFEHCTRPVIVHKKGQFYIEHASGTNGTVFSENAEITVGTPFAVVNCKTGAGTDIGLLTGVSSGRATIHVNAVLDCGFLLPSASWKATYETFSLLIGLGVSA